MGPKLKKELILIDFKSKTFRAKLNAISFVDNEFQMVYIPSLNISGYGETIQEAKEMADEVMKDFSTRLLEQPESKALIVLNKYGWQRERVLKKRLRNRLVNDYENIKKSLSIGNHVEITPYQLAI